MGAKRYKPEDIISKLREAEVLLAQGVTVGEVVRRLGVTQVTYDRWRKDLAMVRRWFEHSGEGRDEGRSGETAEGSRKWSRLVNDPGDHL